MAGVGNSQSQSQNQKQEQRMVAIPTNIAIGECLSKSDDELLKQINDELEVNPALEKVSDEESGDDEKDWLLGYEDEMADGGVEGEL